jgi:hypothetical protein
LSPKSQTTLEKSAPNQLHGGYTATGKRMVGKTPHRIFEAIKAARNKEIWVIKTTNQIQDDAGPLCLSDIHYSKKEAALEVRLQ